MKLNLFAINKFDFLTSIYIFCISVAELMGAKTFSLLSIGSFKLNASVAIFVLPLLFSINDIIIEVYGVERARSVVRSGLFVIVLIIVFTLLATSLHPSQRFSSQEPAYDSIFTLSARISAASLIAFALSHFLDIAIFTKLREKLGKKSLWLRNNLSNFISQFFDSSIFILLAFYSLEQPLSNNVSFLTSLILPYWLLKCLMSVVETPFVYLGVKWLKGETKK